MKSSSNEYLWRPSGFQLAECHWDRKMNLIDANVTLSSQKSDKEKDDYNASVLCECMYNVRLYPVPSS